MGYKKNRNVWKDLFEWATNEWEFKFDNIYGWGETSIEEFFEGIYPKEYIKEIVETLVKYAKKNEVKNG